MILSRKWTDFGSSETLVRDEVECSRYLNRNAHVRSLTKGVEDDYADHKVDSLN